ncbi:MAG TPA: TonB-dependent receptor [Parvularculaceae bacterium]|nr:TonB-dependent receptor [Amphiplicatus sp.]MCB9955349.1 TonB-dependent receptor [Caulobacterales bacterium]HPE31800.1 TonB-dependent receptor [Parvularculaceae bacterium]HRX38879.1 TonB-dependent receptor [Parvularculaceae bacterium]
MRRIIDQSCGGFSAGGRGARARLLSASALVAAAAVAAGPVAAQTASAGDEIVVTAQKREQSIQDIGLSVSALSGEQMLERNVDNLEGVLGFVPGTGFYDVTGGGVPIIILRGVGLQNFRINDTPTTAIYVDEVYQTSVAEAAATLFDVERVEVIKGPQGGLYGRNAVGGAVQVISRAPSLEETEGYLNLGYGQYGRFQAEGAVGVPLSDSLGVRLSGRIVTSDDTYYHSVSGGFDHGAEEKWAMRGVLLFKPSDSVEIRIKGHGGSDTSETPLLRTVGVYERLGYNLVPGFNLADGVILNAGGAAPGLGALCAAVLAGHRDSASCETLDGLTEDEHGLVGRYDSASNFRPRLDNNWWGVSAQGKFDFGDYTLTSITAYDDFTHGRLVDYDAVPTVQQHVDYNSEIEAWSQELRLGYDAAGDLSWLIGASYAEDTLMEGTLLTGQTGLVPLAFGGLTEAFQPYTQETKAIAGFAHVDWKFSDQFNLILEGRYTSEEKSFEGGVYLPQIDVQLTYANDSKTYSAFTGKAAIEWTPTNNALLYASVSRGFKSGGFFGGFATSNAQLEPFDKETILAYEAGFKTDWLEQNLRLNGAVFYYDRQDMQATGFDTSGAIGINKLTNVGDAEVIGGELEMAWTPADFFSLQGNLAYVHSEIVSSDKTTSDIFVSTSSASFKGARLPNQPEFSANVIARVQQDISTLGLGFFQAEYSYASEQDLHLVVIPEERAVSTEKGYSLVNLRAGLQSEEGGWSASVFVTNVFDEKYRTVVTNDTLGGVYELYGAPRIWGVSLGYSF